MTRLDCNGLYPVAFKIDPSEVAAVKFQLAIEYLNALFAKNKEAILVTAAVVHPLIS